MRCAAAALVVGACSSSPQPGWMASTPDATSLAALTLPGTHDTMALYELIAGTAQAQTLTLAEQYAAGIRFVDIRCVDDDNAFDINHGPEYENASFDDVLAATDAFLDAHPSEAIVMSVRQEEPDESSTEPFEQVFRDYVAREPTRWYTGDSVPALGDVRGKIVLLRRFDVTQTPLGIDGSTWQDDTTFTLTNTDSTLRIEDDYVVTDPQAKWSEITSLFSEARTGAPATLYISFTSGYETIDGLPSIPSVSDVINPLLDTYVAGSANAGAHLGILAMDFATAARVQALIALATP